MDKPSDRVILDGPWEVAEYINKALAKADAYRVTSERLKDAHEYVQKYCMPDGWNKNVWHSILDDAIKLRQEKEQ